MTEPAGAQQPVPPLWFFDRVHETFHRAVNAAGTHERWYSLAGHAVCLCFAGTALRARVTPAFEHLAITPQAVAALTVCLWDTASTGATMPPCPWSSAAQRPRQEVSGYDRGRIRAAVSPLSGAVSLLDCERDLAFWWIHDATAVPYYETGSPLLAILHWWLAAHGRQLIHAGAVGNRHGAALLLGKGGSGKSTSTLACVGSALGITGDDYCVVSAAPPHVWSLYNCAKLDADSVHRSPLLEPALLNAACLDREKRLYALHPTLAGALLAEAPVAALLLPRPSGHPATTWHPASAAEALRAAAPSTVLQLAGAGGAAFALLAALARRIPSYVLDTGTDLAGIPAAITRILAEAETDA